MMFPPIGPQTPRVESAPPSRRLTHRKDEGEGLVIVHERAGTHIPRTSQHAVAPILALIRELHRSFGWVGELNSSLAGLEGFDLHGKAAGVIATGRIGRIVAEILKGSGCGCWATTRPPTRNRPPGPGSPPRTCGRSHASDVVALHMPLTPETRYVVRHETLDLDLVSNV
jgi:lactate dehydrogenase-like 2-hydroxyacid dehydrogenase